MLVLLFHVKCTKVIQNLLCNLSSGLRLRLGLRLRESLPDRTDMRHPEYVVHRVDMIVSFDIILA